MQENGLAKGDRVVDKMVGTVEIVAMKFALVGKMVLGLASLGCATGLGAGGESQKLRLAVFSADVTPPLNSALCYGNVKAVKEVVDPLTARGVVLFGAGDPVVLCAVDFVGINNESNDRWRRSLAAAAGTRLDRVAVHTIHNHDSPGCDISAAALLEKQGLENVIFDREAHDKAIEETAAALKQSLERRQPVTHVGKGKGIVEKFASNRRILGDNGKMKLWRASSCRNPEAIAAPEGIIDPELSLVSFWNGDRALAVLTFYASHPQSYYGKGGVTPDTSGLARGMRETQTGVTHIHFNGAGGNIAAGKYNDGSPGKRAVLTRRMAEGMKQAWESQEKEGLAASQVDWGTVPVSLPWRGQTEDEMQRVLLDPGSATKLRVRTARDLVSYRRWKEGRKIDIGRLRLGSVQSLFFPGELFVEYQLLAKKMCPGQMVTVAAYGDGGPGYIGTKIAYGQGGYEVGRVSLTGPGAENVLLGAMQRLLRRKD